MAMIAVPAKKALWKLISRITINSAEPGACFPCKIDSRWSSFFFDKARKPIGTRNERGGVIGAFGLVDALRDCLSSWRRRTVMKPFLNIFRQLGKINLCDSRFCFQHDAVRLDSADLSAFVFFTVN